MSSLTLSVSLLVAFAIVVVIGCNLWLLRRTRRLRVADPANRESARDGARDEPSLGAVVSADLADSPDLEAPAPLLAGNSPVLDPYTDCIVELELPSLVAGERLATLGNRLRRVGSKPVAFEAAVEAQREPDIGGTTLRARLHGDDSGARDPAPPDWRAPQAGRHYRRIRVGALLANRGGPMNPMEFSEFIGGVQSIAEQLHVLADTPDMNAVLARARALDDLCASLDAQMGLGIETAEPVASSDLLVVAREAGCVERGDGRHARLGINGEAIFTLAVGDTPNRLSLVLDVPRVPPVPAPWPEMLACARLFAERLRGQIVDDFGRPLSDRHLEAIGQQVEQRQQALEDAGFTAGSALALRLFN